MLQEKRPSLPLTWHLPKTVAASGRYAVTASEAEVCVWCLRELRLLAKHPYLDVLPTVNGAPSTPTPVPGHQAPLPLVTLLPLPISPP